MNRIATQEEITAFESEIAAFKAKSETQIGEIIRCHLIIEYYINKCIDACYPELRNNNELRLTFAQKIQLLPSWCFAFPWIQKAVVHLNKLRNKVAHNIHYELTDEDYKPIGPAVNALVKAMGKPELVGIDTVKELSNQASMALFVMTKRLEKASKHGLGAFRLLEEQGYWGQGE